MAVEDGAARKRAILGLEQWKQAATPALMELARSDQQELQILSIDSLARIGQNTTGKKQIEIADFLLSFFPHFHTETLNKALLEAVLYALENMREQGPKIIPHLVKLLDSNSPVAKSMAAFSLWHWQGFSPESIATSEMKEKLVRELGREENPDYSRGYVYALFLLAEKDPSILTAIRPLLQHPSPVVRAGAEEILKRR